MVKLKITHSYESPVKTSLLILLICLTFLIIIKPIDAAVMAEITGTNPPSGVTVEAGKILPLMVGVSYSVPEDVASQVGGYVLWLTIDGKPSNVIPFGGPGSYTFQFNFPTPSTPGTYTLNIALYILTKPDYQQSLPGELRDTAIFTYTVKPQIVTDWGVEKVWITPQSPAPGEEVSFHSRIVLRSTTSTQSLSVEVMCFLDNKQFIQTPIVLTFKPVPSSQEISVQRKWQASEGEHELVFTVDQLKRHNDPTPYPQYNFRRFLFRVDPYYTVIYDIKNPQIVDPGEIFEVAVGVDYKFPENTQLRISHSFPGDVHADEQFDTVMGEGINTYTYSVTAPTPPFAGPGESDLMGYNGSAWVEYDREAGWQHTDPGWMSYYVVMVRRPSYFAVFDSVDAQYLGAEGGSGHNETLGRFQITMHVRHLLPLETGLRLIVRGYNGSTEVLRVEETITQTESVERTVVYTDEYSFPLVSLAEGSYSIEFETSVEYLVEGLWNYGDGGSTSAAVTILYPSKSGMRATRTILDDIQDRFTMFFDWIRRMFGLVMAHVWRV